MLFLKKMFIAVFLFFVAFSIKLYAIDPPPQPATGAGAGAAPAPEPSTPSPTPSPRWDDNFQRMTQMEPYFIEMCVATGIHNKNHFEKRGLLDADGHTFFYLHGACKDERAHFPLLTPCDKTNPRHGQGVTISVDSHLANAEFLIVEDHTFALRGLAQVDADDAHAERTLPVDQALWDRTVDAAFDAGVVDGIVHHESKIKPHDRAALDTAEKKTKYFLSRELGFDFAINYTRNAHCVQYPLTESMLMNIMRDLNHANGMFRERSHTTGELGRPYKWDAQLHNCGHTMQSALADLDFFRKKARTGYRAVNFADVVYPANFQLDILHMGNDFSYDPEAIFYNPEELNFFNRHGVTRVRAGTVTNMYGVLPDNFKFGDGGRPKLSPPWFNALFWPFAHGTNSVANQKRFFEDPRFTDFRSNLAFHLENIEKALAQTSLEILHASTPGPEFKLPRWRFKAVTGASAGKKRVVSQAKEVIRTPYLEFLGRYHTYLLREKEKIVRALEGGMIKTEELLRGV